MGRWSPLPPRMKPIPPILSGNLLADEVFSIWESKWKPEWEKPSKRKAKALGLEAGDCQECTITRLEARFLIYACTAPETVRMRDQCVPPSPEIPDYPIPGKGAPMALRCFSQAFARNPDECIDFLFWVQKTAREIASTDLFRARLAVQEVNVKSYLSGKPGQWQAFDVEVAFKKGSMGHSATVEKAIRVERENLNREARDVSDRKRHFKSE